MTAILAALTAAVCPKRAVSSRTDAWGRSHVAVVGDVNST